VTRYLAIAIVAAASYAILGGRVSALPPHGIDLAGRALAGDAPRLALIFTASCWWPLLVKLGCAALVLGARSRAWRARAFGSVIVVVTMWQISDVLKNVFRRPRPEYWVLIREPSFAYSSGHAMFATIVYATWAWFVWNCTLPRAVRLIVTPLLAAWACGILWSRLALGAHYVTDLVGGVLLGVAALAIWAAVRAAPTALRAGTKQHGH
jgi:undecaprenyl-diphosphatase